MEKLKYEDNLYHPFPMEMRGNFSEFQENNQTRFIELDYIEYNEKDIARLKKQGCLESSIIGEYLSLIDKNNIKENTSFLYKIQTYLGNPTIYDTWEFNQNIKEYKQYVFPSFSELMCFCHNQWNLDLVDFVPIQETHIPTR
jgi:hypothetical protein